jgi:hypothetical protein
MGGTSKKKESENRITSSSSRIKTTPLDILLF